MARAILGEKAYAFLAEKASHGSFAFPFASAPDYGLFQPLPSNLLAHREDSPLHTFGEARGLRLLSVD